MSITTQGMLYRKWDAEVKSPTFTVREFVVLVPGTHPQFLKFQLSGDRVGMLDLIQQGATVNVEFEINGREWEGKFFTTLKAWKVDAIGSGLEAGTVSDAEVVTDEDEIGF